MNSKLTDPTQCIWVATDGKHALVRIEGRASFNTGPTMKQLGGTLIDKHYTMLVLDMAECNGVDSTFLGVLAGLASRMKKNNGNAIIMINLSPPLYENVGLLGLDRLIDCYEDGQTPADVQENLGRLGKLNRLDIAPVDKGTKRATAIEAHKALIRSDARNLPRFRDVLTFLQDSARSDEDQ